MLNWELFTAFLALTVVILIAPGPIVTLLVTTSATQGIRAGLTTVAGTAMGSAAQLALIAAGLTWILDNAAPVFEVLQWAGALYLVWIGLATWRSAAKPEPVLAVSVNIRRGFIVALANPNGIAFYSAFLPQFLDPSLAVLPQLAIMCAVSVVLGAITSASWAVAAGLGRAWIMGGDRSRLVKRIAGAILMGGGIWLLLARRPG